MKSAGYFFEGSNMKELVYARPPHGYPRFHIYLKIENENLVFNLHLDQKKPIYRGASAHAGEYQGQAVEDEAKRIKTLIKK